MKIKLMFAAISLVVVAVVFRLTSFDDSITATPHTAVVDSTLVFDKMDHEHKVEFMRTVVMPTVRPLFAAVDSVKYAKINCMTCHGDGAKDHSFKMPNPKLIKMPKDAQGFTELRQKHPDMMRFMMTTLKPTMAKLLGKPEFDMKTHTGFGCGNCHTAE